MAGIVLEEPLLRSLERLRLAMRRPREGVLPGERASTRRGGAVEFIDFRAYVAGDDPRQIDWHAYARLDRPFVRLYREEEDLPVHLLVDTSRSMAYGRAGKLEQAMALAAALGYVALTSGDPLQVGFLEGERVDLLLGGRALRGRAAAHLLFGRLGGRAAGGAGNLDAALARYARQAKRAGLVVLISDLMTPDGARAGLQSLLGRGFEAAVVQVLAPEELEPELLGDLRLVDAETGAGREVTLDAPALRAYRARLARWLEGLRGFCLGRGVRYACVRSDAAPADLMLRDLRAAGIVE